jgi:hypothetical protein
MVTATTTSYDLHRYSYYYIFTPHTATAPITSSSLKDLYYSSNHLIPTHYIVTATLMILRSILFQQLNRPQDL